MEKKEREAREMKEMKQKASDTVEDYIKVIYQLAYENEGREITVSQLTKKMRLKSSAVYSMLSKLSGQNLLSYQAHKGVKLSDTGSVLALKLIRRHRLWESFLYEKLGFDWGELHELAEKLEHVSSDELTAKLEAFLGYPKNDPHGDPIPDVLGNMQSEANLIKLSKLKTGEVASIARIVETNKSLLFYLKQTELTIGKDIKMLGYNNFDSSYHVQTDKGQAVFVSEKTANIMLVTKNEEESENLA